MSYLYEYMSADELTSAKEDMLFENACMKMNHAYDCLMMEHEIRVNNIDTECLVREYTQEDLEKMYVAEMAVFTEGVKEWWEKFKAWVKNTIASIFKKKDISDDTQDPNEIIELDYDTKQANSILTKIRGILKRIIDVKKDDGSGIDPKKLATRLGVAVGAAAGTTAVIYAVKKKVKISRKDAEDQYDELNNNVNGISNDMDSMTTSTESEEDTAKLKMIQELVTGAIKMARDAVSNIAQKLGNKVSDVSDSAKKGAKNVANQTRIRVKGPETISEAIGLMKKDKKLNQAWSELMTWNKTRGGGRIKGKINRKILEDAILRAQKDSKFAGDSTSLNGILSFLDKHNINESADIDMTFEEMNSIMESSDDTLDGFDFVSESASFGESVNDILTLIDSL